MAARRKWNPQTGRFEIQNDGNDTTADDLLDNTFTGNSPTTTTPTRRAVPPRGRQAGPSSGPRRGKPTPPPTTTPVSPTTTVPKSSTTTTPKSPTTTAPKSPTTTTPVSPTTTVPKGTTTTAPKTYPFAGRSRLAGGANINQDASNFTDTLFGSGVTFAQLVSLLQDGSGSASSAAQKLQYEMALEAAKRATAEAAGKAGYEGGMAAATAQESAAAQAKALYEQLASSGYTEQMKGISDRFTPQFDAMKQYYTGQSTAAQKQINDAAAAALGGMVNPTAYQNLQSALLSAPTQNLGLGTYGATGQLAQQQGELDANTAKFLSDLVNRGYQQTQAANQDYNTALRNAVTGTQAANLQGLTNLITGLQAQDTAGLRQQQQTAEGQAADIRQQMLLEGIKALLQGQTTAASTRASTLANYGAYAPK